MRPTGQARRVLLYVFLLMIVATGAIAALSLVSGSWQTSPLILASTAIVGFGAVLAMGCVAAWERRRWHPLGAVATAGVAAGVIVSVLAVWDMVGLQSAAGAQFVGIVDVAAFALAHVAMLSLARLRRGHEVARIVTVLAALATAFLVGSLIVDLHWDVELGLLSGIAGIVSATGTLAVVVLHLISKVPVTAGEEAGPTDRPVTAARVVKVVCPRCEKPREAALGRSACGGCGLAMTITVEEEHCPKCGYLVYGLRAATCPECGTALPGAVSPSSAAAVR